MNISMIKSYNIFQLKIHTGRSSIYQFLNFGPVEESIEKQDEEQTNFLLQKFSSQLNIV